MRQQYEELERNGAIWKGAVAGVVGGLVASWVMNGFQAGLSKASEAVAGPEGRGRSRKKGRSQQQSGGEDATMKAAEAISEAVLDRTLTKKEKRTAGPVLHYAFGSTVGAVYGAIAELAPRSTTAWGLPFGAAVWLGADEMAVPMFGLSKSPREYPASTHASALAAHLVYGLTTDLVRRAVRAAL
jgi:putative membrane protein